MGQRRENAGVLEGCSMGQQRQSADQNLYSLPLSVVRLTPHYIHRRGMLDTVTQRPTFL